RWDGWCSGGTSTCGCCRKRCPYRVPSAVPLVSVGGRVAGTGAKRVVAGVDISALGRRVADRARLIAEPLGAEVELVHVVEPVAEAMIEPALARLMREREESAGPGMAEWCQGRASVPGPPSVVSA